ncbi:MAG: aminoacyl-tRNA deacylase [Janthinobacterium lividum]
MTGKKGEASGTPALRVLRDLSIAHTVHAYEHIDGETAFGVEAVAALRAGGVDIDADRVFKTLLADVDGRLVVAVVPVGRMLDLKALASAVDGKRAALADPVRAQRSSGYVLGGISPLGQRTTLETVLDVAARGLPTLFVSAGRRGMQVELAPTDLMRATDGRWAAVAR